MRYSAGEGFRLHPKEKFFFEKLLKKKVPFLLVGLSAAVLQGAPVTTQDIDLWLQTYGDENFKEVLKEVGAVFVPTVMLNPPMLAGEGMENIDLVTYMSGLDTFEEEFRRSKTILVEDLPLQVLPLERIIKSKKAAGRPKDQMVLYALEDALKVIQEMGNQP